VPTGRLRRAYELCRRVGARAEEAVWQLLGWVLLPAVAVLALVVGTQDLGPAWTAGHGGGRHGSFTAVERSCQRTRLRTVCSFYGTFTTDDATLQRPRVLLDEPPDGMRIGDRIAVSDGGGRSAVVYPATGSTEWLIIAALMTAAVVVLAIWATRLHSRSTAYLRHRRNTQRRRSATPPGSSRAGLSWTAGFCRIRLRRPRRSAARGHRI
jgi:hypothetical protein